VGPAGSISEGVFSCAKSCEELLEELPPDCADVGSPAIPAKTAKRTAETPAAKRIEHTLIAKNPACKSTAVFPLMKGEARTAKWLFSQEKAALNDA
jgi:hypothetical protein